MQTEHIRAESPWQFGPERKLVLPNRREQIRHARQMREFISANRFGKVAGFTRLLSPVELAKISRAQGLNYKPTEIELAAARELIAIAQPTKGYW